MKFWTANKIMSGTKLKLYIYFPILNLKPILKASIQLFKAAETYKTKLMKTFQKIPRFYDESLKKTTICDLFYFYVAVYFSRRVQNLYFFPPQEFKVFFSFLRWGILCCLCLCFLLCVFWKAIFTESLLKVSVTVFEIQRLPSFHEDIFASVRLRNRGRNNGSKKRAIFLSFHHLYSKVHMINEKREKVVWAFVVNLANDLGS